MPRSIEEIIEHADELTRRFERMTPAEVTEVPVEEYLLQRAVVARARGEQQVMEAVARARAAGVPWKRIAALLGTSAQAAQQRYAAVADAG